MVKHRNTPEDEGRLAVREARRVVVKLGTAVLTTDEGYLDVDRIARIAGEVADILPSREVFLVSSGAIGAGMGLLEIRERPKTLPELQAAAAAGQSCLMQAYAGASGERGFKVAQVLLTREDFDDRRRYLNARNTLTTLAAMGVVPVINENDTVSVDEIGFSDNDILAALVTNLLRADLLVILTDVDGLYDGDPESDASMLRSVVEKVDEELVDGVSEKASRLGSGGMASKLKAASIAAAAGETVVIANGRTEGVLAGVLAGEPVGTLVLPAAEKMASRKRWIGLTAEPKGVIVVDEGAERALRAGKSLLPSGISGVEGAFGEGDVVSIRSGSGGEFARGLTNYECEDVRKIQGLNTSDMEGTLGEIRYEEVIRRENLVILEH